jgi:glycosyltransferase involved in cell wall biosynthesis
VRSVQRRKSLRFVALEQNLPARKTVAMNPDKPAEMSDDSRLTTTRQIADHLRREGKFAEAVGLYHHILRRAGDLDGAMDAYVRCARSANHDPSEGLFLVLRDRPGSREIRSELIRMERGRGNHQRVRDLVDAAPQEPEVDWLLSAASAALNMADDAAAMQLYSDVQSVDPSNDGAAAGIARINARKRNFTGVLAALDDVDPGRGVTSLTGISMRIAAHRRLGRTAEAARSASLGLDALLEAGNLHDAARLLDRMNFSAAAESIRDMIQGQAGPKGRSARSRLAGQLVSGGRISAGLAQYRKLGGRKWLNRISPANRDLFTTASLAFGSGPEDREWYMLEQLRVVLPQDALAALLMRGRRSPSRSWDRRRVLLVTGTLGAGGAERQVALTATGLARRGAAPGWPRLATLQDMNIAGNAHLLAGLEQAGVVHHDLATQKAGELRRMPLRLAYCQNLVDLLPDGIRGQLNALCHLIVAEQPGTVHGWQDATGAISALAALLCGVPRVVIGTRSVAPDRKEGRNRPWLRDMMRSLLADPRVSLLNNSRSGASDYGRWLNLPPHGIAHVPNGFELTDGAPASLVRSGEGFTVGGVMRLTEEKRPDLWLDAVLNLIGRHSDVRGLLVGDGPMMAELAHKVAHHGVGDRIELAGRCADMQAQYARMNALMLTSRTEGLPNVLVEAQACGLPVISTNAGGAGETFVDGVTGLLCMTATPEGLADAAAVLLDDQVRCRAMGQAGVAHVHTEFGLEKMLDRTAAVYGWPEATDE